MIHLLCAKSCACFIPFIENFHFILDKHNIPHDYMFEYDASKDKDGGLWLVIWNSLEILPKKCIIFNYDPMCEWIDQGLTSLISRSKNSQILKIVDYCTGPNKDKMHKFNLPYEVMYYGYSPYYDYIYRNIPKNITKDIDILMYGNFVGRRIPMLTQLKDFCLKYNYKLYVRHNNLYGIEKLIYISRAKIILSYASQDTKDYKAHDLARSAELISTGSFTITEYIGDDTVEKKMDKYVPHYATIPEMLEKITFYLENPAERSKMIEKASELFPLEFNLEKSLIDLII